MLHTVKMIRECWPEYDHHELVVLSPCLAKRREFDETETKAFNVTYRGLVEWLNDNDVDLSRYPEEGFTGPPAERAARFSTPGGLMLTAERDAPGISARTKKIEGTGVYGYLDSLSEAIEGGYSPLMIDCLNCEKGCNGGPGTEHQHTAEDLLAKRVEDRIVPLNNKNKTASRQLWRDLKDYWKPGIFSRSYDNRSGMVNMKKPTNTELEVIYEKMRKTKPEDFLHCASCGYGNCEQMAVAIHNGLNRPENCHQYRQEIIWQEKKTVQNLYVDLHDKITGSETLIKEMTRSLEKVNLSLGEQGASLEESSASIEQMMASINNLSRIGDERRVALDQLVGSAQTGEEDLKRMVDTISQIAEAVQGIGKMVGLINGVAARTSLLSMNAAIEAAHAGDAGRGFAVVAEEVRKLAEATEGNVKTVGDFVTQISERAREGSEVSGRTGDSIGGMIGDIHELNVAMRELLNHTDEMSTGSLQITSALGQLTDLSGDVKSATGEMSGAITRLEETLGEVLLLSESNMEQINALSAGETTDKREGIPA
jgi:ABC-type transporter Mla subunit MlaD